ncbi:aldehyde dehydrogenase [Thalassotalea maritima]|uniref:aldehyde dehydrogenase family protein n=1 Tax=Thalassotalea maritima TaxID=3242416 RepID=UPI003527429D
MSYQFAEQRLYIGDDWHKPARILPQMLNDANTGAELMPQCAASDEQIEVAVQSAKNSFDTGVWPALSYHQRADYLDKIADNMLDKEMDIAMADSIQTGVILALTRQFAKVCSLSFRHAAKLLRELPEQQEMAGERGKIVVERLPLGVAGIIAPWNAPSGIACHKLASALAAGCSVVYKPSEWTTASAQYISEAIIDANLPKGVFQLLLGDGSVGEKIVAHQYISAVSFTGGAVGGEHVGRICGQQIKPAQLELGGNNALVILASADLDAAAEGVVTGLTTMNAQWCRAVGRIIVDASVKTELMDKIKQRLAHIRLGHALDSDSHMGPLVHQGHWQHIRDQVQYYQQQGGNVVQMTSLPDDEELVGGWFFPPTLIEGLTPELTLQETFGPVATVHTFTSLEQAIAMANQTNYGLAAYVFGEESHAWDVARRVIAGVVKINNVSLFALRADLPRAAWRQSGLGDEGIRETFEFFRGTRVTGVG